MPCGRALSTPVSPLLRLKQMSPGSLEDGGERGTLKVRAAHCGLTFKLKRFFFLVAVSGLIWRHYAEGVGLLLTGGGVK